MFTNLLMALAVVTARQQIWTVDDDGPADFPSISLAVSLVSEGDILLVQPGSYDPFTLDKSLSIIAPAELARPVIIGTSKVSGANDCSLVHLQIDAIEFSSVSDRATIDDCRVGPPAYDPWAWTTTQSKVALRADQCSQLLVTRTDVTGSTAYTYVSTSEGSPFCAAHLTSTDATFTDCRLIGGNGQQGEFDFAKAQGGTGLRAESSRVVLAATTASGGIGASACGVFGCGFCGSGCAGPGGHAVWSQDSEITIRGNPAIVLTGGDSITTSGWPEGKSIRATASSLVIASGILTPSGIESIDSVVLSPDPAEPFLIVTGDDALGFRRVLVFGPADDPSLVAFSLEPALATLPGIVEGAIWLDLDEILLVLPLTLGGQDSPASLLIAIPEVPSLVGLTAITQALCPNFAGTLDPSVPLLTNAGQMVLH